MASSSTTATTTATSSNTTDTSTTASTHTSISSTTDTMMTTTKTTTMELDSNFQDQLNQILQQNRTVMIFQDYTPSIRHIERMKQLAQKVPELYNNPKITPRSKWLHHPQWHQNSQMPPFHIHFRTESQSVIRKLYNAHQELIKINNEKDNNNDNDADHVEKLQQSMKPILKLIQSAQSSFECSMRGLNGHVRIEEYSCFPLYKQVFPQVDIRFLYQDHDELHASEQQVYESFDSLVMECTNCNNNNNSNNDDDDCHSDDTTTIIKLQSLLISTLQTVLQFDQQLMTHLGEEEEIVVPMSLTEKEIWF